MIIFFSFFFSHTAKIVTCYLQDNQIPYAVSLVHDTCKPTNLLRVTNNYKGDKKHKYKFTVCGSILHKNYDNYQQLIHSIEVNMLFGADHFVFYDHSTGAKAKDVLKKYQQEGIVDVIPWQIPKGFLMHYYGQAAQVVDCQYSIMHKSQYIVVSDVDEVIVPKGVTNWNDAMLNLTPENSSTKPRICAAIYRNTFFSTKLKQPKLLNDTENKISTKYRITALLATLRDSNITPGPYRGKWIGDLMYITMASVHFPQICRPDGSKYIIDLSEGLLHHYRQHSQKSKAMKDDFMLQYKDIIIRRITDRYKQFNLE